ncbi:hypothetical protein P154DRAFT_602665 [Amniculicola lignicola CBS 123094]|uniref:F-box domain-containing protein n=1 Tax=Amniculicola lignicola CBS 123094 TaxID=1392246 RepID=A0A6A5WBK3_9PLEO|nr:hypothetical protein P154DRAFT_602665 [Amniculicola lignicola CBS 123094]
MPSTKAWELAESMETDHPRAEVLFRLNVYLDDVETLPFGVGKRLTPSPNDGQPIVEGKVLAKMRPRPSAFESLPYELLEKIYSLLDLPVRGTGHRSVDRGNGGTSRRGLKVYGFVESQPEWPLEEREVDMTEWFFGCGTDLLHVNRNLRAQVMNLLFECTTAQFDTDLSSSNSYQISNPNCWEHRRVQYQSFALSTTPMNFTFLRHIDLGESASEDFIYSVKRLREVSSCRLRFIRQAMSIRFIAQHCPLIKVFRLAFPPQCISHGKKSSTIGLASALKELAKQCDALEQLGIYVNVDLAAAGALQYRSEYESAGVNLQDVPSYLREDLVEEWMKGVVEKYYTEEWGANLNLRSGWYFGHWH